MLRKTREGFEIMEERNKRYLESLKAADDENADEAELADEKNAGEAAGEDAAANDEPHYDLEKGDLPAIIISAFLTFLPIILALGGALALAWILLH